jgi:hypothetical protein
MLILKLFNNFEHCLKVFVNVYMQVTGKLKKLIMPRMEHISYILAQ